MTNLTALFYHILDFTASLCLLFDVDWDNDFEDDEYVIERRRAEIHEAL